MATTIADLNRYWDEGVERGASHVIVVCDTFDHEDYPVYVMPNENALKVATNRYGYPGVKQMQRVMECYDLSKDRAEQVTGTKRVFNF